jgi:hypothetical protein
MKKTKEEEEEEEIIVLINKFELLHMVCLYR